MNNPIQLIDMHLASKYRLPDTPTAFCKWPKPLISCTPLRIMGHQPETSLRIVGFEHSGLSTSHHDNGVAIFEVARTTRVITIYDYELDAVIAALQDASFESKQHWARVAEKMPSPLKSVKTGGQNET